MKVYQTLEGRILWTGAGLLVLLLAGTAVYGTSDPEKAMSLALALLAHIFGGRAAGIGLCIMAGFNPFITLFYNLYVEVLIVFIAYAVFVLSMANIIKLRWIQQRCAALSRTAAEHQKVIEKYGWVGLFLFVMIPLPVTGPVTGVVMGHLFGIGPVRNFSAALSGTFTAIVFWVFFFDFLERHVHIIQYLMAGLLVIIVLSHINTIRRRFFK